MWSSFEMKIISTDENYFLSHTHHIHQLHLTALRLT